MAKRLSSSVVNWSLIIDNLPPIDKSRVLPLKIASDKYLREIVSKPAELPKIDWNLYKSKITAPGMVDSFQKSYESLKIPYPSDQGVLAETEKLNSEILKYANDKYNEIMKEIQDLKEKLKQLESLIKISEMTIEEYFLAKPHLKIDLDNPKYFFPYHIQLNLANKNKKINKQEK